MARRGILVTHESIRYWCNKFGPYYARRLRRGHRGYGAVSNLFNLGRHLVPAGHYRTLRQRAFASWDRAAAI